MHIYIYILFCYYGIIITITTNFCYYYYHDVITIFFILLLLLLLLLSLLLILLLPFFGTWNLFGQKWVLLVCFWPWDVARWRSKLALKLSLKPVNTTQFWVLSYQLDGKLLLWSVSNLIRLFYWHVSRVTVNL